MSQVGFLNQEIARMISYCTYKQNWHLADYFFCPYLYRDDEDGHLVQNIFRNSLCDVSPPRGAGGYAGVGGGTYCPPPLLR